MNGGDAELVETGGFRIDRKRALKKLTRYQLPAPERGAFFWVRAAVAAGAKRYEVRQGSDFLELRFNGKPFSKSELADPYGGLFDAGDARRRQFALGLLWLIRLEPSRLTIDSGGTRLSVESLEKEALSPSGASKNWTVVYAKWGGLLRMFKGSPWKRPAVEYGTHCPMSGLEINVSGREIEEDPFSERIAVHEFSWRDARVQMSYWHAVSAGVRSHVDLSVLGVRADVVRYKPRFVPCWAMANLRAHELDASEFKAVKNERLDALCDRIASEERHLLAKMLDAFESGKGVESYRDSIRKACTLLLKNPKTDRRSPLLRRLWDARDSGSLTLS
jgi:hypothetical protein